MNDASAFVAVRLLYEVGQNFKREKRQMVVVQGERMEGLKHVITMTSVDWPAVKTQHGGDEENDDKGRAEGDGCDDGSEEDDDVADDGGDGRRGGTRDPASKKKKNGREDVGSRRDGRGKLDSDFYNKQAGNINNVVDDDVVVDKVGGVHCPTCIFVFFITLVATTKQSQNNSRYQ